VIVAQLLIVVGVIAYYELYLPHRAHDLTRSAEASREQKIKAMFQEWVVEDSSQEISVPLDGTTVKRHPQRLRTTFSPREAEAALGAPDTATTDFRGGQHLIWIGTAHKLEASFNAGRLYCLSLEDRATGHGALVYESFGLFHPY
jgi:hypothetical protein